MIKMKKLLGEAGVSAQERRRRRMRKEVVDKIDIAEKAVIDANKAASGIPGSEVGSELRSVWNIIYEQFERIRKAYE
jgi:hypothetical protein